jgi:phage-related holin
VCGWITLKRGFNYNILQKGLYQIKSKCVAACFGLKIVRLQVSPDKMLNLSCLCYFRVVFVLICFWFYISNIQIHVHKNSVGVQVPANITIY